MKLGVPFILCFLLMVLPAHSETGYVKDDIEVMVRTDPGARRKIVAMPTSGTRVEVLETKEGWSKVRLPDNVEGWMLSRYLSPGPPNEVIIASLKRENQALRQRVKTLNEENPRLKSERSDLQKALAKQTKTAGALSASYETLKKESSEFLALKASYEKVSKDLAERTQRQGELEEQVKDLQNTRTLRWFLAGAGVLFVGFVVGFMTRRPKRRPSLL
ncbi:MAG: TIGR04211 family SH3 domain-containing protein [Desulfobacterales bacterium]|nr:MAG: TIGR04211 family SH3 domain-containing protein [Desulfobacterales bacterium]